VSPALVAYLWERDGGCVAPLVAGGIFHPIDPATAPVAFGAEASRCGGSPIGEGRFRITVEHVRDAAAMGAPRAPSDRRHTVLLCEWHHLRSGWSTSHKSELRAYLASVEGGGPNV
jgi:hypothetical protein